MTNPAIWYACEVKQGREYVETYRETDRAAVYESLAEDLVRAKLCGCTGYRFARHNNYDGSQTITVGYDNGVRRRYHVTA